MRQGYGPLYDRLQQILVHQNPAGLDLTRGDARDDYGLPVGTLIPKLPTVQESDLRDVLHREMTHWYRDVAGPPERYNVMAGEIWQAWTAFQRDRGSA